MPLGYLDLYIGSPAGLLSTDSLHCLNWTVIMRNDVYCFPPPKKKLIRQGHEFCAWIHQLVLYPIVSVRNNLPLRSCIAHCHTFVVCVFVLQFQMPHKTFLCIKCFIALLALVRLSLVNGLFMLPKICFPWIGFIAKIALKSCPLVYFHVSMELDDSQAFFTTNVALERSCGVMPSHMID